MRTDAMNALRAAVAAACASGKQVVVTAPLLAEMLGVSGESQMQMIRRRLHEMTRRGELEKVGQGKWLRTGKEPVRRGVGYQRMWRAIRSGRGTFEATEVVQLSRVERSTVYKYLRYLEDAGLVMRADLKGNTILYRLTGTGRDHRETPYPLKDIPDSYHAERAATAALCRILLLEDVEQPRVRRKIREQLAILHNRFNQDEKSEETNAE